MKTTSMLCGFSVLLFAGSALAASSHLADWPTNADPVRVGRQVTENFLPRKFRFETTPSKAALGIIYPEACTWYGALTFARLSSEKDLSKQLIAKFDPLLTPEGAKRINRSAHVDYRVFGIVPCELFLQTRDARYLEIGKSLADAQWAETTPDGITREARYWIDDMYMLPAVQVQAFRATRDTRYLDRAALAMDAYLKVLQQPNGLFYHGTNSHFFWGRGNGWVAAGMAEMLRDLPKDHPHYAPILQGYRTMMGALLKHQAESGMWRQLIDDPESWPESSGTAMFTFAMVTGVKSGWLDAETFGPAARKAWIALTTYVDAQGNVREVCVGTNKGDTRQYYLDRPRVTGDLHGQAPLLWTISALLR
jgi:rhamnogalacturonyl hydrolase YesR